MGKRVDYRCTFIQYHVSGVNDGGGGVDDGGVDDGGCVAEWGGGNIILISYEIRDKYETRDTKRWEREVDSSLSSYWIELEGGSENQIEHLIEHLIQKFAT